MNVLLIVLDSVRAANCSLYGYKRATTPALERLVDDATVYEQARAPSNWSLPSHVSLFTGLETAEHGVTIHDRLEPGHTVWDDLGAAGFDTGLFTENGFVAAHDAGLHEPFDRVVTTPEDLPDQYRTGTENDGPDGFYYADRLLDWTKDREGWAACLNLMDAHRPYEPAPAYDRWGDARAREIQSSAPLRWEFAVHRGELPYWQLGALETLYDGGIRQADAVLDRVVETLRERGAYDDTLLVVCGDHGEGFGEYGPLDGQPRAAAHIVPTTESLLHVPLVVKHPGQHEGGRVAWPAALTAFPDVVRAAMRGRRDSFVRGRVVASKQPVTGDLRARYDDAAEDPDRFYRSSRAVYEPADTGVRKTVSWGEQVGTVHVPTAGTTVPRGEGDPDVLAEGFADIEDAGVATSRTTEPSPASRDQLEALGYF